MLNNYLHIGNDLIINTQDIIGIFDISKINNDKFFDFNIIEKVNACNNEDHKTMILCENNKEIKAFLTNISSNTLVKRIKNKNY